MTLKAEAAILLRDQGVGSIAIRDKQKDAFLAVACSIGTRIRK